jgi:hypothetical protein
MSADVALVAILIAGWFGFMLGCVLTRSAHRAEIEYQRRMAGEWFARYRDVIDDGESWKYN